MGYGPVPAEVARRLVLAGDQQAQVWVRRLYTDPGSGQLVGVESTRRAFPAGIRRLLVLRDQVCRTPYCGEPIRHADHAVPVEHGGPTSAANGDGWCEACNYAKQAPGWRAAVTTDRDGRHTLTTTTPTGHTYRSRAPDPPGADPPPPAGGRAPRVEAA